MVTSGFTSITVKWQPLSSPPGQVSVSEYRVKYKKHGGSKYNYFKVDQAQSEAEITGLERNTAYEIRVAGYYIMYGVGPYSKELILHTKTGALLRNSICNEYLISKCIVWSHHLQIYLMLYCSKQMDKTTINFELQSDLPATGI